MEIHQLSAISYPPLLAICIMKCKMALFYAYVSFRSLPLKLYLPKSRHVQVNLKLMLLLEQNRLVKLQQSLESHPKLSPNLQYILSSGIKKIIIEELLTENGVKTLSIANFGHCYIKLGILVYAVVYHQCRSNFQPRFLQ